MPRPIPDQTVPMQALREVRFGFVRSTRELRDDTAVRAFVSTLGPLWSVIGFGGYAELAAALADAHVDLAWLPPVAYTRARKRRQADLVLTVERARSPTYVSALIARRDSSGASGIEYAHRKRACWVDPWSASGYVVPRRMLRKAGIDPERALLSQTYCGSHVAAVESVLRGAADIAGTFVVHDAQGAVVQTAWAANQPVRILAQSEPIPADTICVSPKLDMTEGRTIAAKLLSVAASGMHRELLLRVFGAERFVPGNPARYDTLSAWADDEGVR